MRIQILNNFKGDEIREIVTSEPEGRGTASKLISDLIRTGSALFFESPMAGI